MRMHDLTHPDDLARNLALFESLANGGSDFVVEKRYLHKNGHYVWVNNSVSTIRDHSGQSRGLVAVVIDITKQKMAEESLMSADRRKNEFLAILAHELRNPLAAVRGAVGLLKLEGQSANDLAWVRDLIDRQTNVLSRLTDDLLDVSRISTGKIHLRPEPLEIGKLLARSVESVHPLLDAKGHRLVLNPAAEPILVRGDAIRLEQVFTNLLSNAAKYTNNEGLITVTCARDQDFVVITVNDTGIGIPADMIASIFGLFTQVDTSLSRTQGGLGIGLTLVKQLVEMHGGTVSATSEGEGLGSEFTVRLPTLASDQAGGE